jgi:hypothetical protein
MKNKAVVHRMLVGPRAVVTRCGSEVVAAYPQTSTALVVKYGMDELVYVTEDDNDVVGCVACSRPVSDKGER